MAPEAMSQSLYSTASDIYAFGILAFEILFEEHAFNGLEGFDLIDSVVNGKKKPQFPGDFERDDVKDVLEACWRSDPLERPNAGKVCKRLMKVIKRMKKKQMMMLLKRQLRNNSCLIFV